MGRSQPFTRRRSSSAGMKLEVDVSSVEGLRRLYRATAITEVDRRGTHYAPLWYGFHMASTGFVWVLPRRFPDAEKVRRMTITHGVEIRPEQPQLNARWIRKRLACLFGDFLLRYLN